ncbi:MAG: 16S rRNA (guanine(966)-N(2))-methyltransferase RsmD [Phycisphaeraceae bacterium]|nr:16S rRNA (guanine(966)-N(2))-methyltransferase RsmD [Phycisphaeraceae bacterium]
MRIIAGEYRSRKLQSPPEKSMTRPIPDRVKESLFNILRGHFEDAHILDCFAGTGSVGLEALSRGAAYCTFVERDREVARVLEENIRTLGCRDRCQVVVGDALGVACLARLPEPVHVAFFDPPYAVVTNDLGWRRTRDQLARAIAHLEEGGYLVHRTPWPFVEAIEPRNAEAEDEPETERDDRTLPGAGQTGRRTKGHRSRREPPPEMPPIELSIDLSDPSADAALEAFEEELARATGQAPRNEIDLSIPGAIGPETHVYGTTALHLYQAAPR